MKPALPCPALRRSLLVAAVSTLAVSVVGRTLGGAWLRRGLFIGDAAALG